MNIKKPRIWTPVENEYIKRSLPLLVLCAISLLRRYGAR
jgi:hypothetical protein